MVGPVIFDTVKRYLTYVGYDVTWIVNITDVDDKVRRSFGATITVFERISDFPRVKGGSHQPF